MCALHIHVLLGRIPALYSDVRPIVTDGVAWSVGRSVTIVSPAKTAEPTEMT